MALPRSQFVQVTDADSSALFKDTTTTAGSTYLGEIDAGYLSTNGVTTTQAASVCRISKIDGSGNIYYAAGGQFNQVWNNRAALSYP